MSRKKADSESVQLAKAINSIVTKQESFVKAVNDLAKWKEETFFELGATLESKKDELKKCEEALNDKETRGKIDIANKLAQYKRESAIEFLKESDEVPVKKEHLDKLLEQIKDHDKAIAAAIKEEISKSKAAVNVAVRNAELKHTAETATITATVDQQKREIKMLTETILNLKNEIAEQRKLTKDVATASRAAPITQNLGK